MKKIIIIGDETNLLKTIRKNCVKQSLKFNKYQFSNDNFIYQLGEETPKNVSIITDLSVNLHDNLWGLFFTLDFLKSKNVNIDKLIFPYFPYSRSNHENENYTSGLFSIISYLNKYNIGEIVTFDPHFEYQKLPLNHKFIIVKQEQIFENILSEKLIVNSLIIGPDKGSQQRIDRLRNKYKLNGFTLNKTRDGHNEKVEICVTDLQREIIRNSEYISIFDDEICSGSTLQVSVSKIKEINPTTTIDVFVSHNFLKDDTNRLFGYINKLYTTNSIHNNLQTKRIEFTDLSTQIIEEING